MKTKVFDLIIQLGENSLIGDVLQKMVMQIGANALLGEKVTEWKANPLTTLTSLWGPLGFTRSLQQILDSTEWIAGCDDCKEPLVSEDGGCENEPECEGGSDNYYELPKDPNAEKLFTFLLTLGL